MDVGRALFWTGTQLPYLPDPWYNLALTQAWRCAVRRGPSFFLFRRAARAAQPGEDRSSGTSPEEEHVRERRRDYELMFIISPLAASDEGVAAVVERVKQAIESNGGEVRSVNHSSPWGRRKLAIRSAST